jgi:hypothetical protein
MRNVTGISDNAVEIAGHLVDPSVRIIVVSRPNRSRIVGHLANTAQVIRGVEVALTTHLQSLLEEPARHGSASRVSFLTDPIIAPNIGLDACSRSVVFLDDLRSPVPPVVGEFAAVSTVVYGRQPSFGIPLEAHDN